jgi:hypothetical protein
MRGISWLAEDPLASREGLRFMELFGWLIDWLDGWLVSQLYKLYLSSLIFNYSLCWLFM